MHHPIRMKHFKYAWELQAKRLRSYGALTRTQYDRWMSYSHAYFNVVGC